MKRVFLAIFMALSLLTTSCGTIGVMFPGTEVGTEAITPKQQAQDLIDEVNLDVAAAALVIQDNLKQGFVTPFLAQRQLNRVKDLTDKMNKAQEVLDLGFITDAKTKAEAVQSLLDVLRKELAEYAAKEQN
jgi:hypothetical protein